MPTPCTICDEPTDAPDLCPSCSGLLRWVRAYFSDEPNFPITPATRFVDDLAIESLDWMDWLSEAEAKLGIVIFDQQAERIQTVGQFIRFLKFAGAHWPDDLDLRQVSRRWYGPYRWDVIQSSTDSQEAAANLPKLR